MTERKLQLIGAVTIMWNSVEVDLKKLIWTAGDLGETRGQLITADMGNVTLIQVGRNLLLASPYHERTKAEAAVVLSIFDEMRAKRNALVHGAPIRGAHSMLVGKLARFSAKEPKGTVTIKSIDVTEDFLDDLILDLVVCGEFIADCQRKLENEIKFRADADLQRKTCFGSFVFGYRVPEIDKDHLERHLAKLRPQPPKPDKPPKKRKASRG